MTSVDLDWFKEVTARIVPGAEVDEPLAEEFLDAINAKLAEAREEQREACAQFKEVVPNFMPLHTVDIRATPLDEEPLADRIKELESHRDVRKHTQLMAEKMVLRETVREHEQENAKLKARVAELERALAVERECLDIAKSYAGENLVDKCISLEMDVAVKSAELGALKARVEELETAQDFAASTEAKNTELRAAVKKLRSWVEAECSGFGSGGALLAETAHLEEG